MQYSSSQSSWGYSPAGSSWPQQAGGNAPSDCGVPWINVDNSYSMPNVYHSGAARYFPPPPLPPLPPSGKHSDTMTHNINLSITMGANTKSSKPDGLGLVRYRAPDVESFIFDHDKGYRFDPTTGLHYDANSKFFINYELGMLLSWDPLSNTYRTTGDLATLCPTGKVLPWDVHDTSVTLHKSPAFYDRLSSTHKRSVEVNSKTYRIREGTSRSRSNSPARQRYDSRMIHLTRTRRSRSRSASSGKQRRSWRSRTRSVERRGERQRHRSNSRDARMNYYRMSKGRSRSPRPHFKTERQRSRSRSASSSNLPRSWRSRSRSVGRRGERKRCRSNSRDAGRNASQMLKIRCCPQSLIPHKAEHRRSRSRSARSDKRPRMRQTKSKSVESRGRKRHKSNSRDARRNDLQMSKGSSQTPSLDKKILPTTNQNNTHHDGEWQGSSPSQKIERNRDVWNRLGPSIKGENTGTRGPKDSEKEIQTSVARTVRLVRTYDTEMSRSQNFSRDSSFPLKSADDESVFDDYCPDSMHKDMVDETEAPNSIEAKPTGKHLGSRDSLTFDSQSEDQRSRDGPASNQNTVCIEGIKIRNPCSDEDDNKMKRKSENAAESYSSKEKPKEEVVSDFERPKKRFSPMTGSRKIDVSALRSNSNSPARQREDLDSMCFYKSKCGSLRSSKQSRDESNISVSGARNQSKTNIREARRSRSRRPRSDHSRGSQRNGNSSLDSQPEDKQSRDKSASNQKTTPIVGKITKHPRCDNDESKMKLKLENAAESNSSKKIPKEEVTSNLERHKQSRSPKTRTRRVDVCATQSKSNLDRLGEDSNRERAVRIRCRSPRSSERSRDGSRKKRSVSPRNQSRQCRKEVRKSRSRPRTYRVRESQMSDFTALRRRSRSRGSRRNHDWESQISYFRESRRVSRNRSRGRRRSCSIVSRWNHNFDTDSSLSLSSSDDEFVSRVVQVSRSCSRETGMSCERKGDKSIYWSPNCVKSKPLRRNSSIHQRNASSNRVIKHDISHSRDTMETNEVHNIHDLPPKRRKLESRDVSPVNSQSEDERSVGINRSSTNHEIVQDSASVFQEFTIIDAKAIPDRGISEITKKSPNKTPAVFVITKPTIACEDPVLREDSFITPKAMVIDTIALENGVLASSRKIPKEAPNVFVIDTSPAANRAPVPTEKTTEETSTVVVIYKPPPKNGARKPREETPKIVVVIDQNNQPLPEHEVIQPSISQDSTSVSHESANLNTKAIPENRTLEQREKTPDEIPAVVVVNSPMPACDDPVQREDNSGEGCPNVVIDKPLTSRGKTLEEASEVVVIDEALAANEEECDMQNQHDSSPKRKKSESRDDTPCNSPLERERSVDIGKIHTNSINSQDAASVSHEPTTLGTLPETNRAHKSSEKSPNISPVVVTNEPIPECEESVQREDNSDVTPKEVVVDKLLSEDKDEAPVARFAEEDSEVVVINKPVAANENDEPTGKIPEVTPKEVVVDKLLLADKDKAPVARGAEEDPEVVVINKPMAANENDDPTGKIPEETPKLDLINEPLSETSASKPRKEGPEAAREVAVIEIDDEPTADNREGAPEVTITDNGDVLGHLFTYADNTQTNIVLVAPLPCNIHSNASDYLKNQIGQPKDVLKVYVSYENTSGSPCRFMVVSFKTAYAAKKWYDFLGGTIVLIGEDGSKIKAYLHFLKKGNWNCKHCKSFNFFMQSLCSKCYQTKGSEFSPVTISKEPTTWVGIGRLKSSFSTTQSVIESLPSSLHTFNILSVEMISEPSGLSLGLCVFEVESKEEGSRLHKFFLGQERNAIYVVMNEKPKTPDEEYLSLLFDKMTPTNVILVAVIPLSDFPDIRLELSSMKTHLLMLLKEGGVRYKKITFHVDKNVGAPYSYVLITFADTKTAAQWLKSRRKTLNCLTGQNQSPSSDQASTPRFKISLHFSKDNWKCQGCPIRNFPLRSLCHCCFKHREPNKIGPISQSLTPTRWVAIPVLAGWFKTDECIIAEFREILKEFIVKRVEVIRDSECPSLPLACAIEMQGNGESLRVREYLTKEGRFSVFVVSHEEMDERPSTYLSNVPDVMIVEAPPPECIDLTNETNSAPTIEIANLPDLEEAKSVDLTSEVNLSQRTEELDSSCLVESATSNVDQPEMSVNATSEAEHSQNIAVNCSLDKQQPASMDVTNGVTDTTEQAIETATCSPDLTQSGIISVSPVPRLGGNTQWHCAMAFLNYGAEYESVQYCQGNLFGVSYNYCLVHFPSPASAKEWYSKCQGSIKITNKAFPNSKRKRASKAYLHFSEKNWLCDCGKENCHIRSICFSCFKQKGKKVPIFMNSLTPTKYLAVKLFKKYAITELAAIFPKIRCTMYDVLIIKFICDPKVQKDNFGIYILETKFLEGAIALRNYYKKSLVVQSTSYVVLKDRSAGTVVDLGLEPAASPGTENNAGNTGMNSAVSNKPEPDYAAIIWTSLYGFHLDKPPNNVVMISMCLEYRELPVETRAQIQDSLKDAAVTTPESIIYSFKGDVGSPFSYCLVSFDALDTAKKWYNKCKDTFQLEICRPDDQKLPRSFQNCFSPKKTSDGISYFIKSKLHYSQHNWICNCGTSNFPLRSVCHACFKNKNKESGYSVSDATKFVGIKLTECLETNISSLYDIRDSGYNVTKINIGLDPAIPRDPFGIVIFEMQNLNEGIKFRRFLANVTSCLKKGQNQNYDPIVKKLMKILSNSSGITYLIPYQK